jgi:predicted ATPase
VLKGGWNLYIANLKIERFRGISSLDWSPPPGLVVLVGSGDSGKTTILDAIELVLSPRWNPFVSDNDFYGAVTESNALIEITVGGLPMHLTAERKFGLFLRGINAAGELHDEPEQDDEPVLTVRFILDGEMEPAWTVVTDRLEERPISARDRAELGMAQFSGAPNHHFSWSRGSAVMAATSTEDEVGRVLAQAQRMIRSAVEEIPLAELDDAVNKASQAAIRMGAGVVADELRAALSAEFIATRSSGLSLHSKGIPIERSGLGTRRLVALGLQELAVRSGAIILADEIEAGLEPFRLRHLLRVLRQTVSERSATTSHSSGHVLLTTHSPVAIEELPASSLHIVRRNENGVAEVLQVPDELQDSLRAVPESFLAKRVVVCEGKTEMGLVTSADHRWSSDHDSRSLAHVGAVVTFGGGTQTGLRAQAFNRLGFPVCILADSDRPLQPESAVLESEGIRTLVWSDSVATENRVAEDLPWPAFIQMYRLAEAFASPQSVRDATANRCSTTPLAGDEPESWLDAGMEESDIRSAFASAAKSNNWFKRVDVGIELGEIVVQYWDAMEGSDLTYKLSALGQWIHSSDNG